MTVPYRELVELHQFIHTFEYEVLTPLLGTRKLSPFIRVEEYLSHRVKKIKDKEISNILGISVASNLIFAVDYYGYIKKSFGLLSCTETQSNVPVIAFEKIHESWLLKKFITKIILPDLRRHKKNLLKTLYKEKHREHSNRLGKKIVRPRKARSFDYLWETDD